MFGLGFDVQERQKRRKQEPKYLTFLDSSYPFLPPVREGFPAAITLILTDA